VGAVGLRSAVAILIASTSIGLAVGSANAETAAVAELEAPDSADSGIREQRESQYQRREKWWTNARAVLFSGIELSAEQLRGVDEVIEAQLEVGRRSEELRAELGTAQQQADKERSTAIRAESRALRARRQGPHECIEEMRALLSEEQHPAFDMNRARLAAEGQQPRTRKERRQRRRSGADAEVKVKAEGADAEVKAEEADAEVKAE
jgi:hypothetical protein